ncbi:MAG: HAMP domain-containing sensor histidine kinase [Bacteroidota bacterium]
MKSHSAELEAQASKSHSVYVERSALVPEQYQTVDPQLEIKELRHCLSMVHHDLREPTRTLMSSCRMLKAALPDDLSPEVEQYINFINSSAHRLDQQIQAIADYNQAGRDVQLTPCTLRDLVMEALTKMDQHVNVVLDIPEGAMVRCDRTKVQIVLEELIENAIKFRAKEGLPTLIFGLDQTKRDFLGLVVSDNGSGIDKYAQSRIFGMFERGVPRSSHPGIGAGLAIAQRCARAMRGNLSLAKTSRAGSTFVFHLPRLSHDD